MKFLILFAAGALLGSVQCDKECFRAVFRQCVSEEPVPMSRMTLCDEIQYEIECFARFAHKCNMEFRPQADDLKTAVDRVCREGFTKRWFDEEKACYKKSVNASECVAPMNEAMRDLKTSEDFIRSNKKVCNLFGTYSMCVDEQVQANCGSASWNLFNRLYTPLQTMSDSLCVQLVLPTDVKETRPDSFGMINVFATVAAMFVTG